MPSPNIQVLIDNNLITQEEASKLTQPQQHKLLFSPIQELLTEKVMTVHDALALTPIQCIALKDDARRQQIIVRSLDIRFVEYPVLQTYVDKRLITLNDAIALEPRKKRDLCSVHVQQLILGERMTIEQAIHLTPAQDTVLQNETIRELVLSGLLELGLADCPVLQCYIDQELMTLETALAFTPEQKGNFNDPQFQNSILTGATEISQLIHPTSAQRKTSEDDAERKQTVEPSASQLSHFTGSFFPPSKVEPNEPPAIPDNKNRRHL